MSFQELPIGDYVEPVSKWKPKDSCEDDTFRYIDLSSVDQGTKEITLNGEISVKDAPSRARQILKPNDVLVSTVRPNLNGVAYVTDELDETIGSTGFCVLRPKTKKLCGRYLFHWVKSSQFITDMTKKATGQSYPAVSDKLVKESLIPLPKDLDEQKRIAAILDQADSLRRARRQSIEKLNALSQAIFYEMFGDPDLNPFDFNVESLGVICDVRDGTHDSPKYVEDGYPLLTSKNFSSGAISFEGAKNISEQDFIKVNKRSKVDVGDIVMPMIGTIGSPVIIKEEPRFAIKNVALIKFNDQTVTADYIHAILSSPFLERNAVKTSRGGTQKFIALGDIRALKIPVPPETLLKSFSKKLFALSQSKIQLEESFQKYENLFLSLQQRAFRGEL